MSQQLIKTAEIEEHSRYEICCPNCGSHAERHHLHKSQLTRTQCPACDYLMVTCSRTGNVIEAYSPGLYGYPA
ncbi:MAG: replication restart DNA helicase PriA [Cyanobacteriota bacterium]|nr:replication restart DNA helicase PriA [Cyanobacteriota bacterium]